MQVFVKKFTFLFFFSIYSHAAYTQELDIVGLKLGMSVDQVYEALKAYGVDQKNIKESRQFYRYTDGVEQFETDDFVSYINAYRSKDGNNDSLGDLLPKNWTVRN